MYIIVMQLSVYRQNNDIGFKKLSNHAGFLYRDIRAATQVPGLFRPIELACDRSLSLDDPNLQTTKASRGIFLSRPTVVPRTRRLTGMWTGRVILPLRIAHCCAILQVEVFCSPPLSSVNFIDV